MEGNLIKINKWLYPVSWIYGTGVWLRNKLFDRDIKLTFFVYSPVKQFITQPYAGPIKP